MALAPTAKVGGGERGGAFAAAFAGAGGGESAVAAEPRRRRWPPPPRSRCGRWQTRATTARGACARKLLLVGYSYSGVANKEARDLRRVDERLSFLRTRKGRYTWRNMMMSGW